MPVKNYSTFAEFRDEMRETPRHSLIKIATRLYGPNVLHFTLTALTMHNSTLHKVRFAVKSKWNHKEGSRTQMLMTKAWCNEERRKIKEKLEIEGVLTSSIDNSEWSLKDVQPLSI